MSSPSPAVEERPPNASVDGGASAKGGAETGAQQSAIKKTVTFGTDVINVVLQAPDKLVTEAVRKTERFRPRGMIIFASAFLSLIAIGVGLASRVGEITTKNADGSVTSSYVTLWKVCTSTTGCPTTGVSTCNATSTCGDPADFNCVSESRRYMLARAFYIIAMLINLPLGAIGVLDALRRLPGMLPGRVISLRMLIVAVSVAASAVALVGFGMALTTWFGVHCGPASSSLPGSQPGRGPFLALLGAMAAAGATTSACVTQTRFEAFMEEAARGSDANGVVTLTAEQQRSLSEMATPKTDAKKKKRKKWLYDDPDEDTSIPSAARTSAGTFAS